MGSPYSGGPPYHIPQALLAWIYLFFLVGMVSSIWMAKLAQKFGKSRALVISLVITMTGACLTLEPYLWFKIAGLPILTFGFFGSHILIPVLGGTSVGRALAMVRMGRRSIRYYVFLAVGFAMYYTSDETG